VDLENIGEFEIAVIPRSIFSNDGSLLVFKDKSDLQNVIEDLLADVDAELPEDTTASQRVLMIDTMGVVNSMKKTPGTVSMMQFKGAFVRDYENVKKLC
jgi:hypothetical protein